MRVRKMFLAELEVSEVFIGKAKAEEIRKMVVENGGKLEMKETGFNDVGGDYTQILVDGKVVATIGGY